MHFKQNDIFKKILAAAALNTDYSYRKKDTFPL